MLNKSKMSKKLTDVVTIKELEEMNEWWKNSIMLSFGESEKLKMNYFISWHKWFNIISTYEVVERCIIAQKSNLRN